MQNPAFASWQRGHPSQYRPPDPCDSRVSCSGSVVTLFGKRLCRMLTPPQAGMFPAGFIDDHHFIRQQTSLAKCLRIKNPLLAILHREHNTRFGQAGLTMCDHCSGTAGFPPKPSMLWVFCQGLSIILESPSLLPQRESGGHLDPYSACFSPQRESRALSPIQPDAGLQEWFRLDIGLSTRRVLVDKTVLAHEGGSGFLLRRETR